LPVEFRYDDEDWKPSWRDLIDIVERFCHDNETVEELRWLRTHPTDWLMVARYMRFRTENRIAETRRYLKDFVVTDPNTGRPAPEYLHAKAEADKLGARRLHWCAKLDEQINEAKYILGWEKVPTDNRGDLIDSLVSVHGAITSGACDDESLLKMLEGIIRTYDPQFNP
jgi:hypothetical protein